MKELDVLLERFLDAPDVRLETGQWPELESLLAVEDDRLWDWLQDPDRCDARPYRELLVRIRDG
jgi:succinate dehydrogenase flavin-adding protein (antitoxin of CptAB toxin-antitoxin module)